MPIDRVALFSRGAWRSEYLSMLGGATRLMERTNKLVVFEKRLEPLARSETTFGVC